jgi:hypothetical protein
MKHEARFFKSLGDKTRLRILCLLMVKEELWAMAVSAVTARSTVAPTVLLGKAIDKRFFSQDRPPSFFKLCGCYVRA